MFVIATTGPKAGKCKIQKSFIRYFMRITLLETGKTRDSFIREGVEMFKKRMYHYVPFSIDTLPDIKSGKNLGMKEVQRQEGRHILKRVKPGDFMLLLDERGREFDSIAFANYLKSLEGKVNHLLFVIGGPYGFSSEVYERSDGRLSLSRLTFSHQLVRVIFMEQLYRAYTILKGEPYHHA